MKTPAEILCGDFKQRRIFLDKARNKPLEIKSSRKTKFDYPDKKYFRIVTFENGKKVRITYENI